MTRDPFPIVRVVWMDAASHSQWDVPEKHAETNVGIMVTSAGFLLRKNRQFVTVALNLGDNRSVSDSITIPRACVKSIKYIRR